MVLVGTLVSSVTRGIWRATDGETGPGDLMVVVIPLGAARAARSSHTRFNPLGHDPPPFSPVEGRSTIQNGPFSGGVSACNRLRWRVQMNAKVEAGGWGFWGWDSNRRGWWGSEGSGICRR